MTRTDHCNLSVDLTNALYNQRFSSDLNSFAFSCSYCKKAPLRLSVVKDHISSYFLFWKAVKFIFGLESLHQMFRYICFLLPLSFSHILDFLPFPISYFSYTLFKICLFISRKSKGKYDHAFFISFFHPIFQIPSFLWISFGLYIIIYCFILIGNKKKKLASTNDKKKQKNCDLYYLPTF